jgi:hypothetical protein
MIVLSNDCGVVPAQLHRLFVRARVTINDGMTLPLLCFSHSHSCVRSYRVLCVSVRVHRLPLPYRFNIPTHSITLFIVCSFGLSAVKRRINVFISSKWATHMQPWVYNNNIATFVAPAKCIKTEDIAQGQHTVATIPRWGLYVCITNAHGYVQQPRPVSCISFEEVLRLPTLHHDATPISCDYITRLMKLHVLRLQTTCT